MYTIIKNKTVTILKLRYIILAFLFFLMNGIQAQETIVTSNTVIETQADKDWNVLEKKMVEIDSGYKKAIKESVLKMWIYEDALHKERSRLAKAFWDNYPQDERREYALNLFFKYFTAPHFISKSISDSLAEAIDKIPRGNKRNFRLLPIDVTEREKWVKIGDDMIVSVLNSNVSIERKEAAEFQLISREFYNAVKMDNALPKEKSESQYWDRFEILYWQHIRFQLEHHVNKYANLYVVADRVKNILGLIKYYSNSTSDAYWKYFYEITGEDNPLANQPGIKALHKMAKENVAAINVLKEVDYDKPVDMVFTAMDGSKVDLEKLRGKVVLIDFWATYCAPCIKEMPHVRAMYDKYRSQGFEVIGIAADGDENKDRIEAILKKTGANWPQRLDKGSDVTVSLHALYKITSLPTVWLLNKEGVIVDRNARGERLEPLIREHLVLE